MKTKELIELLQAADPSGEIECCVYNMDIHYVTTEPAYWDGMLQVLTRDHSQDPYYNIVGAKYTSKGYKVVIKPMSISDAICNAVESNQDFPIYYSEVGNPESAQRYRESDQKTKKQMKDIEHYSELHLFIEHIKARANEITGNTDGIVDAATAFFEKNINRHDPMPTDIVELVTTEQGGQSTYNAHLSYNDKRNIQWDREVNIEFDGMDWVITKRT